MPHEGTGTTKEWTQEWTRLSGTAEDELAAALTTDAEGSIYIAGSTRGDLDQQVNSGGWDAFLSKLSSDGSKIWTRLLGTTTDDTSASIASGIDGLSLIHI